MKMNPEPGTGKGKKWIDEEMADGAHDDDDDMKPLQFCASLCCSLSANVEVATQEHTSISIIAFTFACIGVERNIILIHEQDFINMTLRKLLLPILSSALRPLHPMHRLSLSLSCSQRGCVRMNGTMADEYGSLDSMGETFITNNFQLEHGEILDSAQVSQLIAVLRLYFRRLVLINACSS